MAWAFLSGWTRLYGLIAMEVFDQISWAMTDPEHLFELELTTFATELHPTP